MVDCEKDCPGYPSEKCGDKAEGAFGYIALGKKPSGTRGGSKPTSTKEVSSTSSSILSSTSSSERPTSTQEPTVSTTPSTCKYSSRTSLIFSCLPSAHFFFFIFLSLSSFRFVSTFF